ncbi:MAG: exostosin family protein [Nitrospinae bacterium]|nr:exostosin family protein [Nitrospinota bacterium]
MLKIFSDKSYLPTGKGHIAMLYPFWGKNPEDPRDPSSGRFDRYTEIGSSFFKMAPLVEADVAVFPGAWEHVIGNRDALKKAEEFIEKATRAGKLTVIFFFSDSDEEITYKNIVIFRTSLYRSCRKPNEFAMPAWSEDFVEKYSNRKLPLREKKEKAVVGFCGYSPPFKEMHLSFRQKLRSVIHSSRRLLKKLIGYKNVDSYVRTPALQILAVSHQIDSNFIIREQFLGGASPSSGKIDFERMNKLRQEYVQNMVESDYILCARGGGNFSYRLYETLSCGRIPVFINTDCVLPYHSEINWKKYCVWLDENEVDRTAEKVAEFHEALSPDDFVNLQKRCRKLWEDWLSPVGFFANFHRHFKIE